ncbi:unnamed protein product [Strongylus vulgaris]|uniref:AAA ATPase AAA+ lid domain-containing protein n=1 Tax=Strongylus vulgaris TaxID=40348 RepID=A0A3P7IXS0_STRVU|nr:unnamed protein product [Strongylus vulgaris]
MRSLCGFVRGGGTHPKLKDDVDFDKLASLPELDGFTGADLAALVHEASIIALKARLFSNDTTVDAVGRSTSNICIVSHDIMATESGRTDTGRVEGVFDSAYVEVSCFVSA